MPSTIRKGGSSSQDTPQRLTGEISAFLRDVVEGLLAAQKSIPGKYLWDETGSSIFDAISRSRTYYPAECEMALLRGCAGEIAKIVGPQACVVEFGSGASRKTRVLLDAMEQPRRYVAIDISRDFLREAAGQIRSDYPSVETVDVCADYTASLPQLPVQGAQSVLGFFPGNSIGNMEPDGAAGVLTRARAALAPAWLLIGQDPNREASKLQQAYGSDLMAAFHKNILARMSRELGAEADPQDFEHEARIYEEPARVEAHLVARRATAIKAGGHEVNVAPGASIRTDVSWKYDPAGFERLLSEAGWETVRKWGGAEALSALYLLRSSDART